MTHQRLVLLVEGDGDVGAGRTLVKRLLSDSDPLAWNHLMLDESPLRVGAIPRLLKNNGADWKRYLSVASKRGQFGGAMLIVDGDLKTINKRPFCALDAARMLAGAAREIGAGLRFSTAVVIARQEFESWLIPGFVKQVNDRAGGSATQLTAPADLEESPRGAKEWIRQHRDSGYHVGRDQDALASSVDLQAIRDSNLRSFRRLESALKQIVEAFRSGNHICTP